MLTAVVPLGTESVTQRYWPGPNPGDTLSYHQVDIFIVSHLLFGVGSLAETGAHQLAKLARQASPRSSCLCLWHWDYTFTSGFLHGCCGDGS